MVFRILHNKRITDTNNAEQRSVISLCRIISYAPNITVKLILTDHIHENYMNLSILELHIISFISKVVKEFNFKQLVVSGVDIGL